MAGDVESATGAESRSSDDALSRFANGLVIWFARHWLFLFNLFWGTYVLLPLLAPLLMQAGFTLPARVIYGVYSIFCHQLPDHSYFLFSHDHVPSQAALVAGGMPEGLPLLVERRFIGNETLGYKTAFCQRDVAIYASIFFAGLVYGLIRDRIRPLPLKVYALFLIPIAVDGLTQMFGLRESDWLLRTITGALFAVASVWLAYPYVDEAMQSVIETEEAKQHGPQTIPTPQ